MSSLIPSESLSVKIYQVNTNGTAQSYVDKKQVFSGKLTVLSPVCLAGCWFMAVHKAIQLTTVCNVNHGWKVEKWALSNSILCLHSLLLKCHKMKEHTDIPEALSACVWNVHRRCQAMPQPSPSWTINQATQIYFLHKKTFSDSHPLAFVRSLWYYKPLSKHQLGKGANSFKKNHWVTGNRSADQKIFNFQIRANL